MNLWPNLTELAAIFQISLSELVEPQKCRAGQIAQERKWQEQRHNSKMLCSRWLGYLFLVTGDSGYAGYYNIGLLACRFGVRHCAPVGNVCQLFQEMSTIANEFVKRIIVHVLDKFNGHHRKNPDYFERCRRTGKSGNNILPHG